MGWNSFDCFGWSVNEREILDNACYMRDNLARFGWNTVVVDFIWAMPGASDNPNPHQSADFSPRLHMDKFGRLLPDEARFPSARGGRGFAGLAEQIHAMGLKFGIHIMRGIPRQAVAANTPVFASAARAKDIADTDSVCPWLNHMYGLNMSAQGAQDYIDSLFALYAAWGVDYIKIDDLSYPYSADEVEGYARAIKRCARHIIMSASPGETPLNQGAHISRHANLWRVSGDFWDNWQALKAQFKRMDDWTPYRSDGHFPDADMLPLGKICLRGPMGAERRTNFTRDEQITLMTLWSIARSPLMLGSNLTDNTDEDLELLTNKSVIDINQYSKNNRALRTTIYDAVWRADMADAEVLALFNLSDAPRAVSVSASDAFSARHSAAYDAWSGETLSINDEIAYTLAPHAAKLIVARNENT